MISSWGHSLFRHWLISQTIKRVLAFGRTIVTAVEEPSTDLRESAGDDADSNQSLRREYFCNQYVVAFLDYLRWRRSRHGHIDRCRLLQSNDGQKKRGKTEMKAIIYGRVLVQDSSCGTVRGENWSASLQEKKEIMIYLEESCVDHSTSNVLWLFVAS